MTPTDPTPLKDSAALLQPGGGPQPIDSLRKGDERNRRLGRNILITVLVRPASLLVPLVVTPFLLTYLGEESYGVYELSTAFAVWLGMGNAGLSFSLMNFLTPCYADQDYEKARQLISTFLVGSTLLLGLVGAIGLVLGVTLPWNSLLKLSAQSGNVRWSICLAIAFTLLAVFCGILDAVYGAFQDFASVSIWDAASKVIGIVAVVGFCYTGMGLPGAILAGIGVPAITKLVGVIDLFTLRLPNIQPALRFYRSEFIRPLLTDGTQMFFLTVSFAAIFQIDKLLLGMLAGASAVAEFSILSKIYLLAFGIYSLSFRLLWPAFGEAIHRKDYAWVKKWLFLTIALGVVVLFGVSGILLMFGKPIFQLWLGDSSAPGFIPSPVMVLSFTACFLSFVWTTSYSTVLNAARILRPQFLVIGTHAVLTVVCMLVLIPRWGVVGAAIAPFLAGLPITTWGYPWLVRKYVLRAA